MTIPPSRSHRPRTAPIAGLRAALIAVLLLAAAAPAVARDHLIAVPGSPQAGEAWPSVSAALASGQVQGGDRLVLAEGAHGALNLRKVRFDPPLVIEGAGPQAHVDRIQIRDSSGLVIRGLQVWPRTPQDREINLVETNAASNAIRLEALDIRGGPNALNYLDWTVEDWKDTWNLRGVRLAGPDSALIGSRLTAVSHGIITEGARTQVIGNEIRGFSRDGMRGLGSDSVFRGNLVRDCIKISNNHDDGFQAWVAEPGRWGPSELRNVTLDANRILEWTGPAAHPLRCRLQGIALFRGPYENWTISNNLVVVSAHHGITLYAGVGSRVVNNTVIAADLQPGRSPWIRQQASRNGRTEAPPERPVNIFANNVATALKLGETEPNPLARNAVSRHPFKDFENPAAFDFRPSNGSRLLGAADPAHTPPQDASGVARPRGGGADMGAFER